MKITISTTPVGQKKAVTTRGRCNGYIGADSRGYRGASLNQVLGFVLTTILTYCFFCLSQPIYALA